MENLLSSSLTPLSQAVGHRSRLAMLVALMGGKALPAGELAFRAGITFQTASSHLRILQQTGFIRAIRCGRHRYYEPISAEIAEGLEGLATSLHIPASAVPPHLQQARYCYDHLAGRLGVMLTDRLTCEGAIRLEGGTFICRPGHGDVWALLGIDLEAVRRCRRKFSPRCIDWSERRPHLAGALGAALAASLERQDYIQRSRDDRSARITPAGQDFLDRFLGRE